MPFTLPTDVDQRPVAVIGAGTLGRRIALMFATRGGQVRIYDPSADEGEAAREYVEHNVGAVAARIEGGSPGHAVVTDDLGTALEGAWLAVEAVPDRLELKKRILAQLDRLAGPDTILAGHSSSFTSEEFLAGVEHPERVLTTHFYMPPVQNAIDIMSDGQTDPGVIELMKQQLPRYGVFPFEAQKPSRGFIFNRIWAAIKRESLEVVYEGVSTPQDVDGMWRINMATAAGPFRMMDMVGLDVVLDTENHYAAENPSLPEGPRLLLKQYVDAGNLGVKTGRGFYDDYPGPGRLPSPAQAQAQAQS